MQRSTASPRRTRAPVEELQVLAAPVDVVNQVRAMLIAGLDIRQIAERRHLAEGFVRAVRDGGQLDRRHIKAETTQRRRATELHRLVERPDGR